MLRLPLLTVAVLSCVLLTAPATAEDSAVEDMQEYMEFAEYSEGSVSTEQLASIESDDIFFIDTRNRG